jgi:uncharacterized protein YwqG
MPQLNVRERIMKIIGAVLVTLLIWAALIWYAKITKAPVSTSALTNSRDATEADVEAFLKPVQEKLTASQRQAAQIEFFALKVDDPLASKLGGAAYWPKRQAPPVDTDNQPLHLLAQIRLEQLPKSLGFPRTGLLQFFIQSTDFYGANIDDGMNMESLSKQRYFKVVHWPNVSAEYDVLPTREGEMLPFRTHRVFGMKFNPRMETLSIADFRSDQLFEKLTYSQAMEAYSAKNAVDPELLWNMLDDRDVIGVQHKLGGYPLFTQSDPRTDASYELLFQLDTDDAVDMMWGDVGVANFFIRPEDLKRGDFSKVAYNWDCH